MSERSKMLARYIRNTKAIQPDTQRNNQDELLDKGFTTLKGELAREFHNQITEVNHEPGCMNTLGSTFRDKDSRVFRIGQEDKGISVHFDADKRTVEIRG